MGANIYSKIAVAQFFVQKSMVLCGWMDGWMGGWMDGWVVRAGLRIAYSNQKVTLYQLFPFNLISFHHYRSFLISF